MLNNNEYRVTRQGHWLSYKWAKFTIRRYTYYLYLVEYVLLGVLARYAHTHTVVSALNYTHYTHCTHDRVCECVCGCECEGYRTSTSSSYRHILIFWYFLKVAHTHAHGSKVILPMSRDSIVV